MKKRELRQRIEDLERDNAYLRERVQLLEALLLAEQNKVQPWTPLQPTWIWRDPVYDTGTITSPMIKWTYASSSTPVKQ